LLGVVKFCEGFFIAWWGVLCVADGTTPSLGA
jgi:hypothetical protein